MNSETIGQRMETLIEHYDLTKNSFAKEIGLTANTVIGKIVNDPDRAPSYQVIRMIASRYPEVNMNWFVTGNGPMLNNGHQNAHPIKYYSLDSSAAVINAVQNELKPTATLNIYGFNDCDYAFDVVGDAMSPRFNPGEIILVQKYKDDILTVGAVYMILTEHQQFLRSLSETRTDGSFAFFAENPLYREMVIPPHKLQCLCLVKGKVRRETY